jgi:hypothetical protein
LELAKLRTLAADVVNAYPVASGLYVDTDGQDGYGALKALRLHLKMEPTRGSTHLALPSKQRDAP